MFQKNTTELLFVVQITKVDLFLFFWNPTVGTCLRIHGILRNN
jgi:hypothetical protein